MAEETEKWRKACSISGAALDFGVALIKKGAAVIEVCDAVDSKIVEQTHTVRKGDTLTEIAQRYGTSAGELKRYNKLSSSKIKINQILKIPAGSGASSSGSR